MDDMQILKLREELDQMDFQTMRNLGLNIEALLSSVDIEATVRGRSAEQLTTKIVEVAELCEEQGIDLFEEIKLLKTEEVSKTAIDEAVEAAEANKPVEDPIASGALDTPTVEEQDPPEMPPESFNPETAFSDDAQDDEGADVDGVSDDVDEVDDAPNPVVETPDGATSLEEETDRVILMQCQPVGMGCHLGDIIINPVDGLMSVGLAYSEITTDQAKRLIASGRSVLNKRVSKTPDKGL